MSESEMIAQFMARRGIRKVAPGVRVVANLDIRRPHPPTQRDLAMQAKYRAERAMQAARPDDYLRAQGILDS